MKGKERCRILKEIRREIAESNDIEFVTSECRHKGDCLGTCPKCEAELRYLERELEKRQKLGRAVAVAGLTVSVTLTSAGCAPLDLGIAGGMEENGIGQELSGDIAVEHTEWVTDMGEFAVEVDGELSEEWIDKVAAVPAISSITEKNAMAVLGVCDRVSIREAWSDFSAVNMNDEHGDVYLTEDSTLIRLLFDATDVLVGVELVHDYYNE